jgi:23S rRNA (guanosine2251-2'-O)-methyltransferase
MPTSPEYIIRECTRSSCLFRFPIEKNNKRAFQCPICGSATHLAVEIPPPPAFPEIQIPKTIILDAFLDNLRSTFNVGAIFRTADGVGFRKIHLCGITPTPDHPKIGKTALGAENTLTWEYHRNSLEAARRLKDEGAVLWALEYIPGSISLYRAIDDIPSVPLVLVVGNERAGVDPGLLALCDRVVWIPMHGQKESLNVAVAFSIAAYAVRYAMP